MYICQLPSWLSSAPRIQFPNYTNPLSTIHSFLPSFLPSLFSLLRTENKERKREGERKTVYIRLFCRI